ncbi:MAG: phage holin family protein [Caldilineaceae bacterium]
MVSKEKVRTPADEHVPVSQYPLEENRSLSELITELTDDFSYLVRKEVELARTETMEKIRTATRSVVLLVAAGLLAYAGLIILLIAAADLLYAAIGVYWISSLIVGGVVLLVAAILYFAGRSALTNMQVAPEKTIETLKDDAHWVKEQMQ